MTYREDCLDDYFSLTVSQSIHHRSILLARSKARPGWTDHRPSRVAGRLSERERPERKLGREVDRFEPLDQD